MNIFTSNFQNPIVYEDIYFFKKMKKIICNLCILFPTILNKETDDNYVEVDMIYSNINFIIKLFMLS